MTVTQRQLREVERRLEFTVITNNEQQTYAGSHVINGRAAIMLAFVLGTRFGMAYPVVAGSYMAAYLREHGEGGVPIEEMGTRHERAMQSIVYTATHPRWEDD